MHHALDFPYLSNDQRHLKREKNVYKDVLVESKNISSEINTPLIKITYQ